MILFLAELLADIRITEEVIYNTPNYLVTGILCSSLLNLEYSLGYVSITLNSSTKC